MPMKYVLALTATTAVACGGGGGDPGKPPPAPATALTGLDAGVAMDGGITALPTYDPAGGFALDPDPQPRGGARAGARDRRTIQLLLRSTPIGAIAAVDGVRLGPTPVLWDGEAAVPHEFTFVLAGHALARYRFVPITNGIVHGRLVKIASDDATPEIPAPIEPARPAPRPVPPPPPPPPPIDAAPPPVIDAAPPPLEPPAPSIDAAAP